MELTNYRVVYLKPDGSLINIGVKATHPKQALEKAGLTQKLSLRDCKNVTDQNSANATVRYLSKDKKKVFRNYSCVWTKSFDYKEVIRSYLDAHGYSLSKNQLQDLYDEYEGMQTFTELENGDFEMVTGNTYAEVSDWIRHKFIN